LEHPVLCSCAVRQRLPVSVFINTIGSSGAFVASTLVGVLRQATGSYAAPMAMLAVAALVAALIVIAFGRAVALRPASLVPRA
jgi:cyanate permease